jgi:hypothetical protein
MLGPGPGSPPSDCAALLPPVSHRLQFSFDGGPLLQHYRGTSLRALVVYHHLMQLTWQTHHRKRSSVHGTDGPRFPQPSCTPHALPQHPSSSASIPRRPELHARPLQHIHRSHPLPPGDRHLTQWVPLLGDGAPQVALLTVTLKRSGQELLGASVEVHAAGQGL